MEADADEDGSRICRVVLLSQSMPGCHVTYALALLGESYRYGNIHPNYSSIDSRRNTSIHSAVSR